MVENVSVILSPTLRPLMHYMFEANFSPNSPQFQLRRKHRDEASRSFGAR